MICDGCGKILNKGEDYTLCYEDFQLFEKLKAKQPFKERYNQGWNEGYDLGLEKGKVEGYKQGLKDFMYEFCLLPTSMKRENEMYEWIIERTEAEQRKEAKGREFN